MKKQQFFSTSTMNDYRFTLEPYKTMKNRYHCPNCNKRTFTRYIDNETNEHISDEVGKCSRLIKCNYHYTPKQYFQDNYISFDTIKHKRVIKKVKPKQPISYIDNSIVNSSLNSSNNFIQFLETKLFGKDITKEVVNKYKIGTSKHWNGATVFWQIDEFNNVRSGKIMLYNSITGRRIKKPYNHINWVHKVIGTKCFNLKQCFFGSHLINQDISKPIAIVESEKTAIISSVYIPEFTWLACGSLNNLNREKTEVLKGRNVVLFPDLKCYDLWKNKIPQISQLANYKVSDLLETKATESEKEQGYDLADYLINLKIDYKKHTN